LPVQRIEETIGNRPDDFMKAGRALDGRALDISPCSFELVPLPRIPLGFRLWPADEEFAARCVMTFDGSIHEHLPLDVIRALAHVLVQRILSVV
jgi:hypothetical protein